MSIAALRRSAAATVAAGLLLLGCSSSSPVEDPSPTVGARAEAIVTARERVVEPAQALGTAAAAAATRLDQLIAEPGAPTAEAAREVLDDLADARDRVEELELGTDTEDVRRAAEALGAAVDAADTLAVSVREVVGAVEETTALDARLAELVASWDEPGSRSQLLARFDEVAVEADDLADTAAPEECAAPVETRTAAAAFVAEATRELRDLVDRRDGNAFDARRAELDEAPWGRMDDGEPRELDARLTADACGAIERARAAAADVAAALRDLQAALNPPDLAG